MHKEQIERELRHSIKLQNEAEQLYKTFKKYPKDWIKERLIAEHWKGRLDSERKRFRELKTQYNTLK